MTKKRSIFPISTFLFLLLVSSQGLANPLLEIKKLINGEPNKYDLLVTKEYCNLQKNGGDRFDEFGQTEFLYFSYGECDFSYEVNNHNVTTAMSYGGVIEGFFFDDDKYTKFVKNLDVILKNWPSKYETLRKMDVQHLIWEIIYALDYRKKVKPDEPKFEIDENRVDLILKKAGEILKLSLLTEFDLENLNSIDFSIEKLGSDEVVERWNERIKEQRIFEDSFPGQLHSKASFGRYYTRVFILSDTETGHNELKKKLMSYPVELASKRTFHGEITKLPQEIEGLRLVLVNYFVVLNDKFEIVPTSIISSWKEVSFAKKLSGEDDFDDSNRSIEFLEINYQQFFDFSDGSLNYSALSQSDLVRRGLLDSPPLFDGISVSSMRGNCFGCHAFEAVSYQNKYRQISFVQPFSKSLDEMKILRFPNEAKFKLLDIMSRLNL